MVVIQLHDFTHGLCRWQGSVVISKGQAWLGKHGDSKESVTTGSRKLEPKVGQAMTPKACSLLTHFLKLSPTYKLPKTVAPTGTYGRQGQT